jgi:mannose-6-phosphate isomerase-like protein (cupin superfamily)
MDEGNKGIIVRRPGEGDAIPGPYSRDILVKASGSDTGAAYSLLEFTAPPGGAWTVPHIHEGEEEAWYILEGQMTFRLDDRTVEAPAGSFLLIPRGTLHTFGNIGSTVAKYLAIFSPAGMEHFFAELAALTAASPTGQLTPEARTALGNKHRMTYPPAR